MTEPKDFIFRPYLPEDRPFIENSWANSYYSACKAKYLVSPETFFQFHRPLRERFFSRPTATVIVASPDTENVAGLGPLIQGWIAVEVLPNTTLCHYLYVKSEYRREYHLARCLIERAIRPGNVAFTHLTPKAMRLMSHFEEFNHWRFLPHLS